MNTATLTRPTVATPRIYIACLAAYNSGRLHGDWIEIDGIDLDGLNDRIAEILARSPEPNVTRRKCNDCGRHFDVGFYAKDRDTCPRCGSSALSDKFASAEEWAIHDYEGFFGMIRSEWPNLRDVVALGAFLSGADEQEAAAVQWLVRDRGLPICEALERHDEVIVWHGSSFNLRKEYARELFDDSGQLDALPYQIVDNIDWQGVADDLEGIEEVDLPGGGTFLVLNADDF